MINLLKGLFSDSNEEEEENIFSKSDDKVPEESENKSENDWEKFSTVEDKEEKYCSLPKEQSNTKDISLLEGVKQAALAAYDMSKNYFDMKKDNTIKADDYFHCKANYEATKRGVIGEKFAQKVGDAKELVDYYKNILIKNKNWAHKDYYHDRAVNERG